MIRNTDGTERLYLSKGDQPIYIENCKIPQHHIDGIRFLYRLYKKKKPGVIINDSSGYGRNLQIVLFLKAMRHLFDKPVLVLCHEGAEHDWMEQFQTWTDLCDDVVLETQKPFVKKLVLINTMSNLPAFSRRDWSVLVMDGDKSPHEVLGLPFKADYKIWITRVNMRKNLDKFSQIYKWLYPKEKFDKSEFMPDKDNVKDVVDKAILLDAFMEDIVAKSEELESMQEDNQADDYIPRRISRKNKDATGTKIKRSRRRIYDDEDDVPLSETKKNEPTQSNEHRSTNMNNENFELIFANNQNDDVTDDFSIDNFKRKSIEEFDEDLLGEKEESNSGMDIEGNSEINLYYEPDTPTEDNSQLYEMDTLAFGNDSCDEQKSNVNESIKDIIEAAEIKNSKQDNIRISSFRTDDDTPSDLEFESQTEEQNAIARDVTIELLKVETEKAHNAILKTQNSTKDLSEAGSTSAWKTKPDTAINIENENNTKCRSPSISDESNQDGKLKISVDDINEIQPNNEISENTNGDKVINDDKSNILNKEPTTSYQNDNVDKISVTKDLVATVTNTVKRKCAEDTMKEMEEKAMKKYKGSILDSLF